MRHPAPVKRSAPGRPTREASVELNLHILGIAKQEFIAKGFDGATIEGIANKAGTSKLTLYRHFESKKGLFIAVAEHQISLYSSQLMKKIDTSQPPERVLQEIGLFISSSYFQPEGQSLIRILISELNRVEGLPAIAARFANLARSPVERYFKFLQTQQLANFDDARLAAIQFVNLCMLGQYFLLCEEKLAIPGLQMRKKIVLSAVKLFATGYLSLTDK